MANEVAELSKLDKMKADAKEAKAEVGKAEREAKKATNGLAVAEKGLAKATEKLGVEQEKAKGAQSKEAKKLATADVKAAEKAVAEAKAAVAAAKKAVDGTTTLVKEMTAASEKAAKKLAEFEAAELTKGKKEAGIRLPQIALDINVRMDKASKLEGQADDHRLAAAILAAEARKHCKASGDDFDAWFAENIKNPTTGGVLGDRTKRFLLMIGSSDNPAEKLAEVRAGNNAASAKYQQEKREKLAAAEGKTAPEGGKTTPEGGSTDPTPNEGKPKMTEAEKNARTEGVTPYNVCIDAFLALDDADKMKFLNFAADKVGAKVGFDL